MQKSAKLKLALLQLNFIVGDFVGNAAKIIAAVKKAQAENVDLCITSELALLGYPPRDLLLYDDFIDKANQELLKLASALKNAPPLLIGMVEKNTSPKGRPLYNAALLLENGIVKQKFYKTLLPTYDVFDEDRYFEPAKETNILEIKGIKIGVTICEDIWNDLSVNGQKRYSKNPLQKIVASSVDFLVNLSASPFTVHKQKKREEMLKKIAVRHHLPLVYVNQVGGNDDLVFDGNSVVFDGNGNLIQRGKLFAEDLLIVDFNKNNELLPKYAVLAEEEIFKALVCGTRDYCQKCGFKKAVLGLSGGIDSALTAFIAAKALGKENIYGVMMPSPYSSKGSIEDSLELTTKLGIKTLTLPINKLMQAFDQALQKPFSGLPQDLTEENLQSRIRGNLLMALSNKYRAILLTTGNKSELAVGYCTIYGDMSGGLAVLADLPKTLVYRLANWINKEFNQVIPESIITKAPSAELRPNQTDQNSLPPYDILDAILYAYIEQYKSATEIIKSGFEEKTVLKVLDLVNKAEFKRKQAALGIKISERAFGVGWRMPIVAKKM